MPDWTSHFIDAALLVPILITLVRLSGLRSFSKMSAFDFAITVSYGSILGATVVSPSTTLTDGVLGLVGLFTMQWGVGYLRAHMPSVQTFTDNRPVLLMRDGEILEDNLRAERVAHGDLIAKLREANVMNMSEVRAVVLETTGDVSVLHGDDLEDALLDGVLPSARG